MQLKTPIFSEPLFNWPEPLHNVGPAAATAGKESSTTRRGTKGDFSCGLTASLSQDTAAAAAAAQQPSMARVPLSEANFNKSNANGPHGSPQAAATAGTKRKLPSASAIRQSLLTAQ